MKLLRTIAVVLVLGLFAAPSVSAANADLIGTMAKNKHLSLAVKWIGLAGLANTLKSSGPYTIFMPTNSALLQLPNQTRINLMNPRNKAKLRAFLLYHVIRGKITSKDVMRTNCPTMIRTVKGPEVTVQHSIGAIKVNDAKVVKPDMEASNGIIHAINKVLIPPVK